MATPSRMKITGWIVLGISVVVTALAVFAMVSVFLMSWLGGSEAFGPRYVPSEVSRSASCQAKSDVISARTPVAAVKTVAAWIMGVRLGEHAGWTQQMRNGDAFLDQSEMRQWLESSQRNATRTRAAVARMASTLEVSHPVLFDPVATLMAVGAFRSYIERDDHAAAVALASAYSPATCEIYKLGAYWGFSILYRVAQPTSRNVYAPEITFYAKRVTLPAELLEAMLAAVPDNKTQSEVIEASEALSRAIAEYWNGQAR